MLYTANSSVYNKKYLIKLNISPIIKNSIILHIGPFSFLYHSNPTYKLTPRRLYAEKPKPITLPISAILIPI